MKKWLFCSWILFIVFFPACNSRTDSSVDPDENLKAGYTFKKGSVLYRKEKHLFSEDSFPVTLANFVILDTLPEFERYVIGDSVGGKKRDMPFKGVHGEGISFTQPLTFDYGAANFDREIVIFPRFWQWLDLGYGYYGVNKLRNSLHWGILHIRGEMITDIKYDDLEVDSVSGNIICAYKNGEVFSYDTIYVK